MKSCLSRPSFKIWILPLAALALGSVAWAKSSDAPEVSPLSTITKGDIMKEVDRAGMRLSDALFNAIDDITVYKYRDEDFNASLSAHRSVYDNGDILSSWTVVDRLKLDGSVPLFTEGLGNLSTGSVGFSIGARSSMEFFNIRQVLPRMYGDMPSLKERKKTIKESTVYGELKELARAEDAGTDQTMAWTTETAEDGKKKRSLISRLDPENQARYEKLWRLLVVPFRLPLQAEHLSRLENGEIVSYVGTGQVELGANVGWNLDPTAISSLVEAGVSYKTFVNGSFRISILKEDATNVKVKLTRAGTIGHELALSGDSRPSMLDGVIIIKNIQRTLKVVPFNMRVSQAISRSFDIGYSYDLSKPEAVKAYERAVRGLFSASGDLAQAAGSGVKEIFTRKMDASSRATTGGLRVSFMFRHNSYNTLQNATAQITFPDGDHKIFTSSTEAGTSWRSVLGQREKMLHNFGIVLDMEQLDENGQFKPGTLKTALSANIEARIEDSATRDGEMMAYILEIEDSVGRPNIFPRIPSVGSPNKSFFYYHIGLNGEQLEKFVQTPDEQMWPLLETAFDVEPGSWSTRAARAGYGAISSPLTLLNLPLYAMGYDIPRGSRLYHAQKIHKRWAKLKTIGDPVKRTEAMGRLFFDRLYSYEIVRLLRSRLDGEKVSFYASGYSENFDRIVVNEGSTLSRENIATKAQRRIGFDAEGRRAPEADVDATVEALHVKQLGPTKVEVSFTLKKAPAALFIQLRVNNWWWPFRNSEQPARLVPNNGQFKEGANTIILDAEDEDSVYYPVAKQLVPGNVYVTSLAVNNDGVRWGTVANSTFRLNTK